MKKDVTVHVHLDNLPEFADFLRTEFSEGKTYYLYPTFWYDNDCQRAYLTICITKELNSFGTSTIIYLPDVDLSVDLYIQFGRLMEFVKDVSFIFNIQPIQYKES